MKIKALTSFCGVLTMAKGEVVDCKNEYVVNDLLRAGLVETVASERKVVPIQQKAPKRSVKKSESK